MFKRVSLEICSAFVWVINSSELKHKQISSSMCSLHLRYRISPDIRTATHGWFLFDLETFVIEKVSLWQQWHFSGDAFQLLLSETKMELEMSTYLAYLNFHVSCCHILSFAVFGWNMACSKRPGSSSQVDSLLRRERTIVRFVARPSLTSPCHSANSRSRQQQRQQQQGRVSRLN